MLINEETAATADSLSNFTLYIFPFSLYSIMARFTYALGRKSPEHQDLPMQVKLVNLHRGENFSPGYLLEVNPKGQVPALTGERLAKPLTSSLGISYWLCRQYPHLLPQEYEAHIASLLSKIHSIQSLSLSVPDKRDRIYGVPNVAAEKLSTASDVTEDYRKALQFKADL
ncbi:hypothetical protein CORC01_02647 [Colletotrichum orchidophilum]|uniref:GST N-terminal domain-containing protein n=1 Tax=Colletotrichum orchidophilum TaxID=1209926 RepID=A0A1G4BL92_9PEZI|nr:uncharacterized protein CORC01_02647 [Colletotrichum orchidophilum]OHF02068.1 hypothetical protein CORC01_02647 [Colletotrichum orchidophilum]